MAPAAEAKLNEQRDLFKPEDIATIRRLLENHVQYTASPNAQRILDNWESELGYFVKVIPNDYRRVMERQAEIEARAMALAESQSGNGDAAGGETLVNAALKHGGSDVGGGNR